MFFSVTVCSTWFVSSTRLLGGHAWLSHAWMSHALLGGKGEWNGEHPGQHASGGLSVIVRAWQAVGWQSTRVLSQRSAPGQARSRMGLLPKVGWLVGGEGGQVANGPQKGHPKQQDPPPKSYWSLFCPFSSRFFNSPSCTRWL